jgi:hypothetical protein
VIDGTIVVALPTVLAAKRAATRAGYPWALAGLFSAASVAFNIAHAPDRPVAQLVFAMAPIALVLTTHLLMQQAGWRHRHRGLEQTHSTPTPVADGGPRSRPTSRISGEPGMTPGTGLDPAGRGPEPPLGMADNEADTARPEDETLATMSRREVDLHTRARQIYRAYQATGKRLSGAALAHQLGTSDRHGRRLLAEFRIRDEGSTGRNGDGAAPRKQGDPVPG